jgi:hypothetical protein
MTLDDNFTPNYAKINHCLKCDFKCSKESDWNRHILTRKHKKNDKMDDNELHFTPNYADKLISDKLLSYDCDCGKKYKYRQGLWKHKQVCNYDDKNNSGNQVILLTNIVSELIKNNNDFKNTIIEICKNNNQNINSNNINNINNSNNRSFNLNLFLNETCKDAMNITDFINSIQLNLTDLEKVGELGYVEGISKIIIDNLKLLDVTERPVHCSDLKREVMYVKDKDKWEKENESNTNIKKLISSVTNKNISLIPIWKKENPDCTNINSNKSTKINKMIMEVMETDKSKDEKIIKNIAKEITIDKF